MNSEHPHTPGRLHVLNGTDVFTDLGATNASGVTADENDGWQIASLSGGLTSVDSVLESMDYKECQANARRMVACWNACNGIETEELEFLIKQETSILDGMGLLQIDISRLQKANLELLKEIRELSMIVTEITEQDIADTMPDEPVFK